MFLKEESQHGGMKEGKVCMYLSNLHTVVVPAYCLACGLVQQPKVVKSENDGLLS